MVGRQRINLDNQRFVGVSPRRQNEQTYDGVLGQLQPVDELTLTYAYIDNVNTIFARATTVSTIAPTRPISKATAI